MREKVWKRHKTSTCFWYLCVDIRVLDRFTLLIAQQHRKLKFFFNNFHSSQAAKNDDGGLRWKLGMRVGKTKLKIDGRKINSSVFFSDYKNEVKLWEIDSFQKTIALLLKNFSINATTKMNREWDGGGRKKNRLDKFRSSFVNNYSR